jgi:RNA polymerase sigma factor for flagellar operon FliA
MDPEKLLLESLPDLERISAFVCRRSSVLGADAEDFHSWVRLRLIENDYAILRKFEARSTLRTYLAVVVQRLMLDYRNHQLGKWRPSAEAKRLGEVAVGLEMLLHRDRRSVDEAIATTEARHAEVSRAEIEAILRRLPQRAPRRREVALEEIGDGPAVSSDDVEMHSGSGAPDR